MRVTEQINSRREIALVHDCLASRRITEKHRFNTEI